VRRVREDSRGDDASEVVREVVRRVERLQVLAVQTWQETSHCARDPIA
jgi:hypothetical protein